MSDLSPSNRQWRRWNLILLPAGLFIFGMCDPVRWGAWVPFPASCGAVSGLPCLFCGMTRALHYLLQGDLSRAIYYNWLSIPFLLALCLLLLCNGLELALRVNLLRRIRLPRSTPRTWRGYLSILVLLWVLQVYLAVSQHKQELLNPRGPLYSLVAGAWH